MGNATATQKPSAYHQSQEEYAYRVVNIYTYFFFPYIYVCVNIKKEEAFTAVCS